MQRRDNSYWMILDMMSEPIELDEPNYSQLWSKFSMNYNVLNCRESKLDHYNGGKMYLFIAILR